MFRGRFDTTMDAKGRTSLPARFREILTTSGDNRLVVTTSLEPCLVAYPYSGWCEFEKKLATLPAFDPNVVAIKRLYVSSAVECPVDSHGRILIPPVLRGFADIEKTVVWSGMVGHIEIWDGSRWNEAFSQAQKDAAGLAKSLAELGL